MWSEISVLFLAVALAFIEAYMSINPNVDKGCGGVNNSVPYLCYMSVDPSAKRLSEAGQMCLAISGV